MTEQTFNASIPGALLASIRCPQGAVRVAVISSLTVAQVTVRTKDGSGPTADAVRRTRIIQNGDRLSITVPEVEGTTVIGSTTIRNGGATIIQNFGTIGADQSVTGMTIRNGQVIMGGSLSSPVEVVVGLPAGSGVQMESHNADLTVTGVLAALDFKTHNGSLRAGVVGRVKVRGHNGTNDVEAVQEWVDIETHNGDTEIGSYSGGAARMRTRNGNIRLSATPTASGRLEASAYNGNIRLVGTRHLDVATSTRNGRVSK
ncbi:DUF4097 family beta strand repeat-containing protein [Streptomyces sp. NPDC051173]|uniref:DUF4097 family beta strand repeat-containing protein n=1 Tax=Streptomyces sp. NPDC051173 TaxID=3155164 RepID=UPI00344CCFF4